MAEPADRPDPGHQDCDATTRLLRTALDRHGRTPLSWAAGPLLDAQRVLDLCCGVGALAAELPAGRWLGVDADPAGCHPRIVGAPIAIPLRTNAVDGICLAWALPRLDRLDDVFAELRRVLRPGGTLVVLVPSAVAWSLGELRFAPLLRPVHRNGWLHRSALDHAGWLLAAADFAVLGDDRAAFTLPMPDDDAARRLVGDLPAAGVWPRTLPPRLAGQLAGRAGPGVRLPVPMRRIVARR